MNKQSRHSAKFLRKQKFFTVLPLLVFPFLTFLLWSVGLIGSTEEKGQGTAQRGFNMNLPDPQLTKDSNWNKLRFYEQADKDSAKYRSLLKNDPYYNLAPLSKLAFGEDSSSGIDEGTDFTNSSGFSFDPYPKEAAGDPNEEKVYRKLAQLNDALHKNGDPVKEGVDNDQSPMHLDEVNPTFHSTDIDRLEAMMNSMQGSDDAVNPEMQQIGNVLEKILDIQHPERVKEQIKKESFAHKGQVFQVSKRGEADNITLLEAQQPVPVRDSSTIYSLQPLNRFYSLEAEPTGSELSQTAFPAIIPETQTLVSGATVKLQLASDIYINGLMIPKNQFVYGLASLNGERLSIHINTIRHQNNILPVDLSVYDLDGMEGIFVPGAITRDVAKQSSDQAVQSISLATLNPSLGAQAADAGLQAAKSLIGKKVKTVKMTIPSGYRVLLYDNKQRGR